MLLYEKLRLLMNEKTEWKKEELRQRLSNGYRITAKDYPLLLKEIKAQGIATPSNRKIRLP